MDATGDEGNDLPRFGSLAMPVMLLPLLVLLLLSVSFDSKFNLRFSTVRHNERFFTRFDFMVLAIFGVDARLVHVNVGRPRNVFSAFEYSAGDEADKRLLTVDRMSDS